MNRINNISFEEVLDYFNKKIDPCYKKAFLYILIINILAFGFEVTNMSLHHDDVGQIFIKDHTFGYHVGRFGLGWFHYYTQSAYFMPFFQMIEGIFLMIVYSLIAAHLFGLRNITDITIVGSIICVFPFMAQIYQYNSAMVAYPLAHLLTALAVLFCIRSTISFFLIAVICFIFAFSIYQSVLANAVTLFLFWILMRLISSNEQEIFISWLIVKVSLSFLFALLIGGVAYLAIVSILDIKLSSYQNADKAFSFEGKQNILIISAILNKIITDSKAFYFWPENYFPLYLKNLQLIMIAGASFFCVYLPRTLKNKIIALVIMGLCFFTPRLLQFIHSEGIFHNLTLTAYALVIAGTIAIILKAKINIVRNVSILLTTILVIGYLHQCNWISTINLLNSQAHYAALTQIMARARSLDNDDSWDGKKAAVIGSYKMPEYGIFKKATGVAPDFIRPQEIQDFARVMRDEITFIRAENVSTKVRTFAKQMQPWPHPNSVGIIDGVAVIVLSKEK